MKNRLTKILNHLDVSKRVNKYPLPREELTHFPRLQGEHPTKWFFPDYLDNSNCLWLQCLKEQYEMPISFPASLSPEAGLMLHSLVRNLGPKVMVEIGVFCSVSTQWMASAFKENNQHYNPKGVIHCFDDFGPIHKGPWRDAEMLEGRLEFVRDRLKKAGLLEYVHFHQGDSSTNVKKCHDTFKTLGGIDLAFIDGDHSVAGVVADFNAVEPVLNTGGFVLLHDTYPEQCGNHEGPRYLIDNINKIGRGLYEHVDMHLSPLNFGMALLRRVG